MFEHPRSDELCYLTFYHSLESSLEEFVAERELRKKLVFALAHRERTRESSALASSFFSLCGIENCIEHHCISSCISINPQRAKKTRCNEGALLGQPPAS